MEMRRRRTLLLLAASVVGASAAPLHAAPPRPEAVINLLTHATASKGTKGSKLPRAMLAQLYANAIKLADLGVANDTLLGDDSDDDDAPPLQAADVSDDDDAPPPPPYVYRPSQDDEFMIGALHLGRDSTLVRAPTPP